MRDWVSPFACALMACAAIVSHPAISVAGELHLQPGIFSDPGFEPKLTFGTSVSHVSGAAHEFVYTNGGTYKLSELDWQINDVMMLNAAVGVRLTPWLAFTVDGGTKLSGSSHMDDYDWLKPGRDWDHWSQSPDTAVKSAVRLDAAANLSLYRHPHFSVDAIGGLRWNMWEFQANGGNYIYSSSTGFRDQVGSFPAGQAGITYKQSLLTPYVGLALNANLGRLTLDATVLGSAWSFAHDYDQHHLRQDISTSGGLFQDMMRNQDYLDLKFGGSYRFDDRIVFNANWERETYRLTKGSTTISSIGSGVNGTGGTQLGSIAEPAAGLDNQTERYTVGLTYSLN